MFKTIKSIFSKPKADPLGPIGWSHECSGCHKISNREWCPHCNVRNSIAWSGRGKPGARLRGVGPSSSSYSDAGFISSSDSFSSSDCSSSDSGSSCSGD